jgi:hypothetical protein
VPSPSAIGALEPPSAEPSSAAPSTAPARAAAKTTDSHRLSHAIELLLAAAVLLGIGGGYGLWVTSEKR